MTEFPRKNELVYRFDTNLESTGGGDPYISLVVIADGGHECWLYDIQLSFSMADNAAKFKTELDEKTLLDLGSAMITAAACIRDHKQNIEV